MPGKFVVHTIPFERQCARCGLNRYGHRFIELEQGYNTHHIILCENCVINFRNVLDEYVKELYDEEE